MNYTHRLCSRVLIVMCVLALIISISPSVFADDKDAAVQKKVNQIISSMPSSVKTDVEKALYLHDYIVKNVAYEKVGDHQTAYGALVSGKAVCAGYADAYLKLLTAAGIEARTITGTATNSSGKQESHAWTMVKIGGKCVYTDVTWDDPFINGVQDPNFVSHDYFNITLEKINKDHTPDAESKQYLPSSCNHTGLDYFSIYKEENAGVAQFNDSTTAKQAATYFKCTEKANGKATFTCEFTFTGSDIKTWIHLNCKDIAANLGVYGEISIAYQLRGNNATMTISGSFKTTVGVTSVALDKTSVTLTTAGETNKLTATVSPSNATNKAVTYSSSNTAVATVSSDGKITAVANGSAVITVKTADGAKTAKCNVTVSIPAAPQTPSTPVEKPTTPVEPDNKPIPPATEPTVPVQPEDVPQIPDQDLPVQPDTNDATQPEETVPVEPEATQPDNTVPSDPQIDQEADVTEPEVPNLDDIVKDELQFPDDTVDATAPFESNEETKSSGNNTMIIVILSVCGVGVTAGVVISIVYKKH